MYVIAVYCCMFRNENEVLAFMVRLQEDLKDFFTLKIVTSLKHPGKVFFPIDRNAKELFWATQ